MPEAPKVRRAVAWAKTRLPELAFVVLGLALRVSMRWWYDVSLGYDYPSHHAYARYLIEHHALPPYNLNVVSYHPPLFYFLAALIEGAGFSAQAANVISVVSSSLQLLLCWLGLELYLRESRFARVLALAIAAILPAAVHVAGMASNEALSGMLCTGAFVLLPQVVLRRGRAGLGYAAAAGVCLGLALLTKVTGAVVLAAFVIALGLEIARRPDRGARWAAARARLPAVAVVLALAGAIGGWHYARNKILYGKAVLTAYDQWLDPDPSKMEPLLDQRPVGYAVYWDDAIYTDPFYPTASLPRGRFWPLAVTTTFSDYFSCGFVPHTPVGATVIKNGKPILASTVPFARASVAGGTLLAAAALIAWLLAARSLWRREDYARLVPLLVGLLAIMGQLQFATRYPWDKMGPVKGAYLHFAGPVYCAMAGLAAGWLWSRRRALPRLGALALVGATCLVAAYTLDARLVIPLFGP